MQLRTSCTRPRLSSLVRQPSNTSCTHSLITLDSVVQAMLNRMARPAKHANGASAQRLKLLRPHVCSTATLHLEGELQLVMVLVWYTAAGQLSAQPKVAHNGSYHCVHCVLAAFCKHSSPFILMHSFV